MLSLSHTDLALFVSRKTDPWPYAPFDRRRTSVGLKPLVPTKDWTMILPISTLGMNSTPDILNLDLFLTKKDVHLPVSLFGFFEIDFDKLFIMTWSIDEFPLKLLPLNVELICQIYLNGKINIDLVTILHLTCIFYEKKIAFFLISENLLNKMP